MLPTPDTDHLSFANIYEPSEDSYLFLDTLSSPAEANYLASRFTGPSSSPLVTEIGPGSGVILAFLAVNASTIFGRRDILTCGVDVNFFACKGTRETVRRNLAVTTGTASLHEGDEGQVVQNRDGSMFLDSIHGSLTASIRDGEVDVLVFNPPYVPSETLPMPIHSDESTRTEADRSTRTEIDRRREGIFERDNTLLALATDGGAEGMEITNKLLDDIPRVLSRRGVAYILFCAQNRPAQIVESIKRWDERGLGRWSADVVGNSGKTGGWEKLVIVRIARDL